MISESVFIGRILLSNFKRLSYPYKLTFALTYRCNLRCKTCFIWKKRGIKELTLDEIDLLFKRNSYLSWLDLTGGEIFLRNDIFEIIESALRNLKNLCILHFPTNGTIPEKALKVARMLKDKKVRLVITVSIDLPDVRTSFKKAMNTYKLLKKENRYTYLGITLSPFNIDHIDKLFSMLSPYSINEDEIHINIFHKSPHYYSNMEIEEIENEKLLKGLNFFYSMKKKSKGIPNFLERRYMELAKKYVQFKRPILKCQALSSTCFIDPKGDIYPCTIFGKKLGNVKDFDFSLKNVWKKYKDFIPYKNCPGCWTPCEAYPAILANLFRK